MNIKSLFLIALCVVGIGASTSEAFAVPFFADTSKQAVFLSPLERWMPTWRRDSYVSLLERAGYSVDLLLNENASISFLRSGLGKYDLIILRTDSFAKEGLDYFCAGDAAGFEARAEFAGEISLHEVAVGACVGFSTLFLKHYYTADTLKPGLVYVLGSASAELSSAFLAGGAVAFIGYEDAQSIQWGRMDCYSQKLVWYLSQGYSVLDSVIELYIYVHMGHGGSADWVMPYWCGDGTFKI